MKFKVRLRGVGLLCMGWSCPATLGPDVQFVRKRLKNGRWKVYVPGSSFKGALRSSASRIADSYGFKSCGEVRPEAIEKYHENCLSGKPCDVCALFGYPKSKAPSPLMVSDFEPAEEHNTFVLTRIRIQDDTLRAAEGALFTSEYVPPRSEFLGEISISSNVEIRLLGLLLLALANLRLDRIGRSSLIDLKVEEDSKLEKMLGGTIWLGLLQELRGWLWRN